MLVFALALIACGLVTAAGLFAYLCENLLALVAALLAGKAALATGGGWPGAILAASTAFALASIALRVGLAVRKPLPLQLLFATLIAAPAGIACFALTEALLHPFVAAMGWRVAIAALTGAISGIRALVRAARA